MHHGEHDDMHGVAAAHLNWSVFQPSSSVLQYSDDVEMFVAACQRRRNRLQRARGYRQPDYPLVTADTAFFATATQSAPVCWRRLHTDVPIASAT